MLKRALLLFFLLLSALIVNAFLNPIPKKNVALGFKPTYGVSFSFEQAGWYGLDSKKSYTELLDGVKFKWVRLPFFWNQMIDSNGNFNQNFEDLKWAINEAEKRNIKVVVALGAKTPYFPEYHWPEYVSKKVKFGDKINISHPATADILTVDKKVVEELSQFNNITYWQVENEPYLANFDNLTIDESLLKEEVKVVRAADAKHRPIILNHVGPSVFDKRYKSLIEILQPGDVLGVNAYFKTQGTNLASFEISNRQIIIKWPEWLIWPVQSWVGFSPDFAKVKNEAEKKGLKFWVLEMQVEPYIRVLDDARRRDFYFSATDVEKADTYLKASRVESVGLWGASFWLFRERVSDESWIETVAKIVN